MNGSWSSLFSFSQLFATVPLTTTLSVPTKVAKRAKLAGQGWHTRQGQQGQNFAKAVGVVCRQPICSLYQSLPMTVEAKAKPT